MTEDARLVDLGLMRSAKCPKCGGGFGLAYWDAKDASKLDPPVGGECVMFYCDGCGYSPDFYAWPLDRA